MTRMDCTIQVGKFVMSACIMLRQTAILLVLLSLSLCLSVCLSHAHTLSLLLSLSPLSLSLSFSHTHTLSLALAVLSLSLSLTYTHTHTHTHAVSLSFSLSVSLLSLSGFHSLSHLSLSLSLSCSGELRMQKLKSHLVRTQSLNFLNLKPGVGQYTAIYATLTARNFFLPYFYHSSPFTCIFPKPLPISPLLAVANTWFLCRPAE